MRSVTHEALALPPLPLEEWEDTKETLHRYCLIAGKVRMECSPYRNHCWHVTLYFTIRNLTVLAWVDQVLKVRRALQRQDQPGSALLAQVRPGRHPLLRQAPPWGDRTQTW